MEASQVLSSHQSFRANFANGPDQNGPGQHGVIGGGGYGGGVGYPPHIRNSELQGQEGSSLGLPAFTPGMEHQHRFNGNIGQTTSQGFEQMMPGGNAGQRVFSENIGGRDMYSHGTRQVNQETFGGMETLTTGSHGRRAYNDTGQRDFSRRFSASQGQPFPQQVSLGQLGAVMSQPGQVGGNAPRYKMDYGQPQNMSLQNFHNNGGNGNRDMFTRRQDMNHGYQINPDPRLNVAYSQPHRQPEPADLSRRMTFHGSEGNSGHFKTQTDLVPSGSDRQELNRLESEPRRYARQGAGLPRVEVSKVGVTWFMYQSYKRRSLQLEF